MVHAVHLIGFPWEEKSSLRRGSALGPWAIRRHLIRTGLIGGRLLPLPVVDEGVIRLERDDRAFEQMRCHIEDILEQQGIPIVLGGDHSITVPVVTALARRYGPVNVIWLDRHTDLHPEFLGDRLSHACAAARILEAGLARSFVQIGVRELEPWEKSLAERWGVQFLRDQAADIRWPDGPTYVSIDVDAVGWDRAGGAETGEDEWDRERLLAIVRRLRVALVGADVVELNPRLDQGGSLAAWAAQVVLQLVLQAVRSPAAEEERAGEPAGAGREARWVSPETRRRWRRPRGVALRA